MVRYCLQQPQAHAETVVTDEMMKAAGHRYPDNTPRTKEAYWYRTIFESHFPQKAAADTVRAELAGWCSWFLRSWAWGFCA